MHYLIIAKRFTSFYNIFCTQQTFVFHRKRNFYIVHDHNVAFYPAFLWIGFDTFHETFLHSLFVLLLIRSTRVIRHFYIYEKKTFIKKKTNKKLFIGRSKVLWHTLFKNIFLLTDAYSESCFWGFLNFSFIYILYLEL